MIRRSHPGATRLLARILGASAALCGLAFAVGAFTPRAASLAASPGASPGAAPPLVLRDDLQHEITLAHPPRRIVSLCPPLTETLCSLGECGRLVATDRYSNWPAAVTQLPKAGGLDDPQIELIVRLHPDLVLISSAQRISGRLRDFGIPTIALDTQTYVHIAHVVTVLGTILDVPDRASALNRQIEEQVRQVAEQAKARQHGSPPRVVFEVDGGPYAAGPDSFIGELLTRLGTRNIVDAELGPFPKLNPEYVVRRNPDIIFETPGEVPNLAQRPGWASIRAVRENRICNFPPEIRDTIVRAGPRIAEGMRAIADCLARVSP